MHKQLYLILGFQLGHDVHFSVQGLLGVLKAGGQILLQHHAALMLRAQLLLQLCRLLLQPPNIPKLRVFRNTNEPPVTMPVPYSIVFTKRNRRPAWIPMLPRSQATSAPSAAPISEEVGGYSFRNRNSLPVRTPMQSPTQRLMHSTDS